MTYKEKYRVCKTWQERAAIVNLFHCLKSTEGKWTMRKTARYFSLSLGLVCEDIKLANHLDVLLHIETRKAALEKIRL